MRMANIGAWMLASYFANAAEAEDMSGLQGPWL